MDTMVKTAGQEKMLSEFSSAWNPNSPFQGTQEEWWEHFHAIEEGNFKSWEEHQKEFYAWKREYLASRM